MSSGPAAALLLLATALLLGRPPGTGRRARLAALVPVRARPRRARLPDPPGRVRRWFEAALVGLAAGTLLGGGGIGLLMGAGVGIGTERLLRRTPAATGGPGAVREDLPVACDLLAVCLGAGTPTAAAVAAVGTAVPGALGNWLTEVGARYRLGASPRAAWADAPPGTDGLGRVLIRAGESGSTVVPALHRLAADVSAARREAVEASVRRAGVWILAPLGLCFLPAFLCLGVLPLVLGIAADVFGAGP